MTEIIIDDFHKVGIKEWDELQACCEGLLKDSETNYKLVEFLEKILEEEKADDIGD